MLGDIELVRFRDLDAPSLWRLLNDRRVLRHMPLADGRSMGEEEIRQWVSIKEQYWDDHGFGPWGIRIGGTLAGWGGLQPWDEDANEVEIALVLIPEFWGWGRPIFERFVEHAFSELRLTHVLAAAPPTRKTARGLRRLGFVHVRDADIDGRLFMVFQLDAPNSPR
jgi:[ribosomal protein S5]-alanine N-acetyltransferase